MITTELCVIYIYNFCYGTKQCKPSNKYFVTLISHINFANKLTYLISSEAGGGSWELQ
jgi:hypothetical protein